MTYQNLLVERCDGVAFVVVNRPAKLNALDGRTLDELEAAFGELGSDSAIGGVVLTGAGEQSFVAGADLEELNALEPGAGRALSERGQRLLDRIERLGKPVVAAVNGYALGGGCELALACHVRIASDNAVFALPEVRLGLICGYGGTQRLPRLVGRGRALELLLTGDRVDATEALRIGLVNKVVFRDRLRAEAEALLRRMLENAPLALRAALAAVNEGLDRPLAEALRGESARFGELFDSADAREGTRAFLEKRRPRFTRQ